jgi:DNA-binding transcriptional regulator LsrR (DeoR family)
MYYDHGLTHQEIADALGLSRIRVTRLLAEARAAGMVTITVDAPDSLFADEERDLTDRYGLKHAFLAPSLRDADKANRSFAILGAEALSHLIERDSLVALGFSREVALVANAFSASKPGAHFVPLAGSTAGLAVGVNPHELALRFAERSGGSSFHLPAPLLASSAIAARAIRDDPNVAEVLAKAAQSDILIVGIGATTPGEGMLFDLLSPEEGGQLRGQGAVGDVGARFFDTAGEPIHGDLDKRIVGLNLDEFSRIPVRVAIARGSSKLIPLRIALSRGFVNVLISDIDTARHLLA